MIVAKRAMLKTNTAIFGYHKREPYPGRSIIGWQPQGAGIVPDTVVNLTGKGQPAMAGDDYAGLGRRKW